MSGEGRPLTERKRHGIPFGPQSLTPASIPVEVQISCGSCLCNTFTLWHVYPAYRTMLKCVQCCGTFLFEPGRP